MSELAARATSGPRPAPASGATPTVRPWPSVDRTEPCRAVLAALAEQRSVLVVGGPGVGKTHLVDAALGQWVAQRRALRAAATAGIELERLDVEVRARAVEPTADRTAERYAVPAQPSHADAAVLTPATPAPAALSPVVLSPAVPSPHGPAPLAPAPLGPAPDLPTPDPTVRTVLTVDGAAGTASLVHPDVTGRTGHVVRVHVDAPERSVLLRVEDAHLMEPAAAEALAALVREGEVQVVATMRGTPTSPWLELWMDGAAERVDVGPLDPAQTEALVTQALGGPVTSETGRRIWLATEGNPFHVRELVRHEVATGALAERQGVWVGLIGAGPGQRVLDVVGRDLDRLPDPARAALELVALAEPVQVTVLDGLVDPAVLDDLVRRGLVVRGPAVQHPVPELATLDEPLSATVRLSPPAFAEAVRALVPHDRRRRLFTLVRTARSGFRTEHEPPAALLRSVLWALECDVHQSGERLLRAMRAAVLLGRPQVAVQVGSAALRQPVGGPGPRVDVLLLRAEAWRLVGAPERAAADLLEASDRLAAEDTGAEHPLRQIRLAEQTADLHQFHDDDSDASLELIDRFLDELAQDDDPALRSVLELRRLARLGAGGRFAESIEPSLAALKAAGYRSPSVLALAAPAVFGLGQTGRVTEAVALGSRSLRAAEVHEREHPWLGSNILAAQFLVHLWAGDVEAAERIAAVPPGGDWGYFTKYSTDSTGRGLIAGAHGLWSDAMREHRAATATLGVADPYGLAEFAAAAGAVAAAALGDRATAQPLMEQARRVPHRASAMVESDLRLMLVDASLWLRLPTARSDALTLARWCAERGLRRTELEALHRVLVAAQLEGTADPTGPAVLTRLQHLGEVVTGRRARVLVEHAAAVVDADAELLTVTGRDLNACGLWLPSVRPSARLTAREREIAGLAAGGLSSRAIADRLTLSVRTVDSHLSRVFAKLGVTSRAQLRDLRD